MYTRIAVPLDGSKTAEMVLPHLEVVASGCGTQEIFLLSVTEHKKVYTQTNRDDPDVTNFTRVNMVPQISGTEAVTQTPGAVGKQQAQAAKYLARTAKKLRLKGITVSTRVLVGNPAQEIINYARDANCDLIIVASHGRSGIDRWAHSIGSYGGVADKILRASPVPVLMIKTSGEK